MLVRIITATGLGALSMYVLDPVAGRARRAKARDQMIRARTKARDAASATARDLKNRSLGTIAEGRARIFGGAVDDAVLAERVRSKLGFLVRHPSFVNVQSSAGSVTLSGPVLSDEVQQLVRGVSSVRGVRQVENRLEVHEQADAVPGFQKNLPKPSGQTIDVLQENWAPSTRFLVGAAGAALLLFASRRARSQLAPISVLAGVGCLLYGFGEDRSTAGRTSESYRQDTKVSGGWTA
jgi:hypothetical protein